MSDVKCPYLSDLWALQDGELDESRRAEVQQHVKGCPICQEEQKEWERVSAILRTGDAATDMSAQKREQLKQTLLEACAQSLPVPVAHPSTWLKAWWTNALRRFRSISPMRRLVLAATVPVVAASIMLILFLTTETPAQALERTLDAMAR